MTTNIQTNDINNKPEKLNEPQNEPQKLNEVINVNEIKKLSAKVSNNLQNILNKALGKKVFIFDLETTGLFDKKDFYKYWSNKVFAQSRIIEIGYYYSKKFGDEEDLKTIQELT